MADRVRKLMEEMVPEIDEYRRRGLYSEPELRALVKRRERFELLCHGRMAQRVDFVSYAQHELRLHALHKLRKRRLGVKKRTQADTARVRRIHFILERACRKWKGDKSLWATWADVCEKTRSHSRLQRVLARALQLHPREPALWIRAAAWEWEQRGSATNARALLQRGLRLLGDESGELWAAYFQFELSFRLTLLRRRGALGLASSKVAGPSTEGGEGTEEAEAPNGGSTEEGLDAIARIAFTAALDAAPADAAPPAVATAATAAASAPALFAARSAAIGARLLRLAAAQPKASSLTRAIAEELRERHAGTPAAALALATYALDAELARARRKVLNERKRDEKVQRREGEGSNAARADDDDDEDEEVTRGGRMADGDDDGDDEEEGGGAEALAAAARTAYVGAEELLASSPKLEVVMGAAVGRLATALDVCLKNNAECPAEALEMLSRTLCYLRALARTLGAGLSQGARASLRAATMAAGSAAAAAHVPCATAALWRAVLAAGAEAADMAGAEAAKGEEEEEKSVGSPGVALAEAADSISAFSADLQAATACTLSAVLAARAQARDNAAGARGVDEAALLGGAEACAQALATDAASAPLLALCAALADARRSHAAAVGGGAVAAATLAKAKGGSRRAPAKGTQGTVAQTPAELAIPTVAELCLLVEVFARQPPRGRARAGASAFHAALAADAEVANGALRTLGRDGDASTPLSGARAEDAADGRGGAWALLLNMRAEAGATEADLLGLVRSAHHSLALSGEMTGGEGGSAHVKRALLAWALRGGAGGEWAERCVRCASAVLALPPNSCEVYEACAQAVCARAGGDLGAGWAEGSALDPPTRVALRAVLERAVGEHPDEAAPWLRLAHFERAHGMPADEARVHWRAVRAVADAEAFSEAYTQLLAGESAM